MQSDEATSWCLTSRLMHHIITGITATVEPLFYPNVI